MIVKNKSKARRSFTVGNQRIDFVNGLNTVPDTKAIKHYVNQHPDLFIVAETTGEDEKETATKSKPKTRRNKRRKPVTEKTSE